MLKPLRSQRSWPTSLGAPVAPPRRPRKRKARGFGKLALMMSIIFMVAGCNAPGDIDNDDGNVILQVEFVQKLEDSNVWGDVQSDEGGIPSDIADVTFTAVLKAPITTNPVQTRPDLQNIRLERYEVTYTRTDGGTATPPGFTAGIAGLVRLSDFGATDPEEFTLFGVTIVPATIKAQPPISFLITPGTESGTNFANIQVNARVQFFGRTVAGHEVSVVANLGINFAQWADVDDSGGAP